MLHDVSPYLLVPRRDLPTACKQSRHARGVLTRPCAACTLSDACRSAMRRESEAVSQLPQTVSSSAARSRAGILEREIAA